MTLSNKDLRFVLEFLFLPHWCLEHVCVSAYVYVCQRASACACICFLVYIDFLRWTLFVPPTIDPKSLYRPDFWWLSIKHWTYTYTYISPCLAMKILRKEKKIQKILFVDNILSIMQSILWHLQYGFGSLKLLTKVYIPKLSFRIWLIFSFTSKLTGVLVIR